MSKTLDRLKKILAKANDPRNNENERDAARRLAESMMAATGITDEDLADPESNPIASFGSTNTPHVRGRTWSYIAAESAGRVVGAFVHLTVERESDGIGGITYSYLITFVGTEQQREAAVELYNWLVARMNELANTPHVIRRAKDSGRGKLWMSSYRMGIAQAIADQVYRMVSDKPKIEGVALARFDDLRLKVEKYTEDLGIKRVKQESQILPGAHLAGNMDGRTIQMQQGVGTTNQAKRLGSGS